MRIIDDSAVGTDVDTGDSSTSSSSRVEEPLHVISPKRSEAEKDTVEYLTIIVPFLLEHTNTL